MKINYLPVNLDGDTPTCQCGTRLEYNDKLNKLMCPNMSCIKKRVSSAMNLFKALDDKAKQSKLNVNLVQAAYAEYDLLTTYIDECNIQSGIELITQGLNLNALGNLGKQLETVIDTLQFEIKELGRYTGSSLLEKFTIDFSKVPGGNEALAIAEINKQLHIDNTIMLAKLIYMEYMENRTNIFKLADYLTLIRPASEKRSTIPIQITVEEPIVTLPEQPTLEVTDLVVDAELDVEEKENVSVEEENTLEDFLAW